MYGPLLEALQSGATVVTANNRLARNLAHAYGEFRQAAGQLAWPTPDILDWRAWLTRLWEESQVLGGRAATLQLISEIDTRVLWEQVATAEQGLETAALQPAMLANEAWQLLCDWEASSAPEWVAAGLSPDQQIFLRWLALFRDRCKAEGWIDPAMLPVELLADADAGLFDGLPSLVFAGFDVWRPAHLALRDALARRGVAVALAADPAGEGACQRIECKSEVLELEQAARWARLQLETDPELSICVVIRDLETRLAEARRVFMDVFCPDWRTRATPTAPLNFSYGEPLANKPRIAAALNLLHLIHGIVDYRHFSLALRTPFLHGGRAEAGARARLDLRLRDRLGTSFYATEALPEALNRAPLFARVLEALQTASQDMDERSLAEWADWITTLLQATGWPGDDTLDSVAYQELEAWHKLFRDFAACSKVHAKLGWDAAFSLLQRLASSRLHQPKASSGGVQIMGILEAAGHGFDRLWVTGMAAEDWPQARQPNPLLPFALQRRCAMPGSSPARDLEYAQNLTARLKASAHELIFSWPGLRDGEQLHASELIRDVICTDTVEQWQGPLWSQAMFASAPVAALRDDIPQEWPKGNRARGGAYLFNLQASCPLRAFLELRLGAVEVDEPVIGISFKARGSLAHRVLEDFYKKFPDSEVLAELDEGALADELNELTAQHMRALPGMRRAFIRTVADLETQRLLPLLMEFVALDRDRDSFSVTEAEQDQEVTVGPLKVGLKLDRLDRLENGSLLVIDYKTGLVARTKWNPSRPGDMQLPLYATFTGKPVNGVAFAQISAHSVKYDGLADATVEIEGVVLPGKLRKKFTDLDGANIDDWEALTAAWRLCLLELADGFAAGDCRINPKQSALAEGQFAVLTRVYELSAVVSGESDG